MFLFNNGVSLIIGRLSLISNFLFSFFLLFIFDHDFMAHDVALVTLNSFCGLVLFNSVCKKGNVVIVIVNSFHGLFLLYLVYVKL